MKVRVDIYNADGFSLYKREYVSCSGEMDIANIQKVVSSSYSDKIVNVMRVK